jgi:hypothetical protein
MPAAAGLLLPVHQIFCWTFVVAWEPFTLAHTTHHARPSGAALHCSHKFKPSNTFRVKAQRNPQCSDKPLKLRVLFSAEFFPSSRKIVLCRHSAFMPKHSQQRISTGGGADCHAAKRPAQVSFANWRRSVTSRSCPNPERRQAQRGTRPRRA